MHWLGLQLCQPRFAGLWCESGSAESLLGRGSGRCRLCGRAEDGLEHWLRCVARFPSRGRSRFVCLRLAARWSFSFWAPPDPTCGRTAHEQPSCTRRSWRIMMPEPAGAAKRRLAMVRATARVAFQRFRALPAPLLRPPNRAPSGRTALEVSSQPDSWELLRIRTMARGGGNQVPAGPLRGMMRGATAVFGRISRLR